MHLHTCHAKMCSMSQTCYDCRSCSFCLFNPEYLPVCHPVLAVSVTCVTAVSYIQCSDVCAIDPELRATPVSKGREEHRAEVLAFIV
jgi:hypothetical protein